ncbi:unnamed protein product [Darwinula stevensoni]|uniref:Peroxinectin n=1 Tax=Darwinula stevensoni TaxID=69355 RepID=A0A7R8XDK7_9CRUS|nr:unnamed protein product [Darwinula stevensoni]CAG0893147.1 unnamed protein product [Darwinula stevensoni]
MLLKKEPYVNVLRDLDERRGYVGSRYMGNFGIRVGEARYRYDYDPSINPSVTNAFAAAAFRFGHTLIQGLVQLFGGGVQTERRELRDFFNNPGLLYGQNGLDRFINALVTQSVQGFDNLITKEVTEHLFEDRRHGFGMDLVSLNLQRSRDHGVRGYNEYRELCGLGRARTFNDFATHINPQVIGAMQKVYENVDDVDLFIGGISERPVDGALLGPTFLCIVGDMFLRLQKGDRFFYDLGNQPHSFTPGPDLLSERGGGIRKVGCGSPAIPRPQFGPWKEGSGVTFG